MRILHHWQVLQIIASDVCNEMRRIGTIEASTRVEAVALAAAKWPGLKLSVISDGIRPEVRITHSRLQLLDKEYATLIRAETDRKRSIAPAKLVPLLVMLLKESGFTETIAAIDQASP